MAPESEYSYSNEEFGERLREAFGTEAFKSGNDDHGNPSTTNETRLEAARKMIKTKQVFTAEGDVESFFQEFGDIAGRSSTKATGNLLHIVVEVVKHNEVNPEHVRLLVKCLVKRHPVLLKHTNKDGLNPIFMAIRMCQDRLISYMISACAEDKDQALYECLHDALSRKQNGETCLHVALKENLEPETIRMLIQHASDKALDVQDNVGKTPMHYAMLFHNCTDARIDLIDLFLQKDSTARSAMAKSEKTFLDRLDKNGNSVYLEHQNQREHGNRWYADRQATYANTQDQADTSGAAEVPPPKEIRPQSKTRDGRRAASVMSPNERDHLKFAFKYASKVFQGDRGEHREELFKQEKDEQERQEIADAARNSDSLKEPELTSRDESRNSVYYQLMYESDGGIAARKLALVPKTEIKHINTAQFESNANTGTEERPTRPEPTYLEDFDYDQAIEVATKNSDKILERLKLHYMRTRNVEMVMSFLYGTNMNDVQIGFDYNGLPEKVVWKEFTKRFGEDASSNLKLDCVLQYVAFPRVEVTSKGRRSNLKQDQSHQAVNGRQDMKYFFDWLYKKGVRHIIKLSVEDSGASGQKVHSDLVIRESLSRFIIEHLDWQKTDLDPETILHINSKGHSKEDKHAEIVPGGQLKKLTLRWSGSNAVLRAWSGPDALPLLPHLQEVEVVQPHSLEAYDSPQWIRKNLKDFETRLSKNRRMVRDQEFTSCDIREVPDTGGTFSQVKVIAIDQGINDEPQVTFHDTPHEAMSAPGKGVNGHRWLDSTARFASVMAPFWEKAVNKFLGLQLKERKMDEVASEVVLALIDDGVDKFDITLADQVLEGKSFDFHNDKVRPPYLSAKGHGTVMASMILRVCPMAKVYPVRLKTYDNANGKNNIDARYAARAIQAALDKKATIISMSWTLPMSKGNDDAKEQLHAVLQKAVDGKVLMFCSAPDEGKFSMSDYPSGPWRDKFFRIGAARADGTVFQWTEEDTITYIFPGVDVVQDQIRKKSSKTPLTKGVTDRVNEFRYETGSSVATALGAGLAAMIIYCVKASILAAKTANQGKATILDDQAALITDPDAMKHAFSKLGRLTPNRFIQVWDELDKFSEVLEKWERSSCPDEDADYVKEFMKLGLKLTSSV